MTPATAEAPPANGNGDPANIAPAVPATSVTLADSIAAMGKAIAETKDEVVESDELVDALYLALASRTHIYICGSGGVGKTFASEVLARHLDIETFYIQFRNDTKREEVFGPLSMRDLQNDVYRHVTKGYMPEAVLANLDEFKDGGRFTRQLLNILNERWFPNGGTRLNVPLRTAVGTTNFWIEETELEALFDRFAQRLMQEAVKTSRGFKKILQGQLDRDRAEALGKPIEQTYTKVTPDMLLEITRAVLTCKVDKHILSAVDELWKSARKENLEPSPRRYGEGLKLARAVAVLAGRDHVTEDDLRVFARVLPAHPDDFSTARDLTKHLRDKMTQVVEDAQRGLEEVRKKLVTSREAQANGQPADYPMLTEASILRTTIEEKIEAARKQHNGGQPHAAIDAVLADLAAEGEFMADAILGKRR